MNDNANKDKQQDVEDDYFEIQREIKDTFVGTVNYLSPEVIAQKKHTFALDMWALGTIFYKMLFGRVAFAGNQMNKVLQNISNKQLTLPTDETQNVSIEAINLLN